MLSAHGFLPPCVGDEDGGGAARDARADAIGTTGQDDRDAGAEHHAGAVRVREETELLGQDVSGLEVGGEEDVGIARDG
jgi:hypothetical protein